MRAALASCHDLILADDCRVYFLDCNKNAGLIAAPSDHCISAASPQVHAPSTNLGLGTDGSSDGRVPYFIKASMAADPNDPSPLPLIPASSRDFP